MVVSCARQQTCWDMECNSYFGATEPWESAMHRPAAVTRQPFTGNSAQINHLYVATAE